MAATIVNGLSHALLKDHAPLIGADGNFNATISARGLYNTFQFVLRLSPEVHRKLSSLPNGIINSGSVDIEGLEAFSVYLHETVHWWQHIGSTYGLMMSLTYPTQAHANHKHLKNLIADTGFKKSVRQLAEILPSKGIGTPSGVANTIINNHFDMEAFRGLTVHPLEAEKIVNDRLFENLGHAYQIAYGNVIGLLSSAVDTNFNVMPDPRKWTEQFRKLREEKEEGYFYGSPVSLYPIGAYEIFEGQARVAQLQYLHFSTGGSFDMETAVSGGMFQGVYGKAFSTFLNLTELDHPTSIDHPTVALFLLICDLAINPGSGFPFPLIQFPTFIRDVVPGARFVWLCRIARLKHPELFDVIKNYSREEYEYVSQKLCGAILEMPPVEIAKEFCRWSKTSEFKPLMSEYDSFKFDKGNIVVRVLFAHFLAFMQDKFVRPEFFCWPGAWMAGNRLSADAVRLFDKHGALFVDKEDDDGIFPRLPDGREEANVQEVFNDFYAHNVVFDLTNQWVTLPGSFKYDFQWLSQRGSKEEIKNFCEQSFESAYGVRPSSVELLPT